MKMSEWIGKSVSIHLRGNIGIFQGMIKSVTPDRITITRAFRNGLPLKKDCLEITIASKDIEKLDVIPSYSGRLNISSTQNGSQVASQTTTTTTVINSFENLKLNAGPNKPNNRSPPNARYNKSPSNNGKYFANQMVLRPNNGENGTTKSSSKPIEITGPSGTGRSGPSNNGNGLNTANRNNVQQRKPRNKYNKNATFGTPVDDPLLEEDFDFEKNLALFDKQAIWQAIEMDGLQKPDVVRQTMNGQNGKYRHDENVIVSEPIQYRQIEVQYGKCQEYVTDEGLVIPSIPRIIRDKIQSLAESHGLTLERQNEVLARGVSEVALQLLGGPRRLTPNNQHQWPKIVIICDEPYNNRLSENAICAGRHLASHGLKVSLFVSCAANHSDGRLSNEIELFSATGNYFTYNANTLPSNCDLVIFAALSNTMNKSAAIKSWLNSSRAPVLAIDPPVNGIQDVNIKCSVLPILPLDDINVRALGKLYLCNLGIPDKFYADSGIKYKSPFDKFVIPIHRQD